MKDKKVFYLVGIVAIFVFCISLIIFIVLKDENNKLEPFIDVSQNLKVEVYSKVKVSDFISIDEGSLVDDYAIVTTSVGKKAVEFQYLHNGVKGKNEISIEVVDTTKPYIGLGKSYTHIIGNDFNMRDSVFCGDNYSRNPKCEIVGNYDLEKAGEYFLTYRAEDDSGNVSEVEFTLKVLDKKILSSSKRIPFEDIKKRLPNEASLMIDVSKWQEDIDWKMVKDSGIDYAMLRIGTQIGVGKDSRIDAYFEKNIKEARDAGVKVGVYYYSYAKNVKEARKQAKWVIATLKDYELDLPVAFDWECWSLFNSFNINFNDLDTLADAFLTEIKEAGYEMLLYSSKNYLENVWNLDYDVWLAHYTEKTNYTGSRIMWQFTNIGEVPGIKGAVDFNFYYNK